MNGESNTVGAGGGGWAGLLGNLVGAAGQVLSARADQRLQEQRVQAPPPPPAPQMPESTSKLLLFGGIGVILVIIALIFKK